jgi:hypothetical protein
MEDLLEEDFWPGITSGLHVIPGSCQAPARARLDSPRTRRSTTGQCKFDNRNSLVPWRKELILADRPQILIHATGRFLYQLVARKCVASEPCVKGIRPQLVLIPVEAYSPLAEMLTGGSTVRTFS